MGRSIGWRAASLDAVRMTGVGKAAAVAVAEGCYGHRDRKLRSRGPHVCRFRQCRGGAGNGVAT